MIVRDPFPSVQNPKSQHPLVPGTIVPTTQNESPTASAHIEPSHGQRLARDIIIDIDTTNPGARRSKEISRRSSGDIVISLDFA